MSDWNPTIGPRINRGWQAIRQALQESPGGLPWIKLLSAADKASDLQPKTIKNLIADARRHGYLEKTTGGRYRLTDLGRNAS